MSDMNVNQVLAQMRAISASAGSPVRNEEISRGQANFSQLLSESIDMVNETQQEAKALKVAFQTGADNVELPEVMIAVQKASVSFEAMNQVRNKLLSAYQEIMNMQV